MQIEVERLEPNPLQNPNQRLAVKPLHLRVARHSRDDCDLGLHPAASAFGSG
jgi:hypothetical protein